MGANPRRAVANATGQPTPSRLRYPTSMALADTLGGGLLGAGLGGITGGGVAALGSEDGRGERVISGAGLGAGLGAVAGLLAGISFNTAKRRSGMRAIKEGPRAVKNLPTLPHYGPVKNVALYGSGPHRLGYSEIMEDLAYGEQQDRTARHLAHTGAQLAGFVPMGGLLTAAGIGVGGNIVAQGRSDELNRLRPRLPQH